MKRRWAINTYTVTLSTIFPFVSFFGATQSKLTCTDEIIVRAAPRYFLSSFDKSHLHYFLCFSFCVCFHELLDLWLNNAKIAGYSNWFLMTPPFALFQVKLQRLNLLGRRNVLLSARMVLNLLLAVRYQILLWYGLLSITCIPFLLFFFANDIGRVVRVSNLNIYRDTIVVCYSFGACSVFVDCFVNAFFIAPVL